MVENDAIFSLIKNGLLNSEAISLKKSQCYKVLKNEKEIDGFNAVLLFLETGIDYRLMASVFEKSQLTFEKCLSGKFYDTFLSSRLMSYNISRFLTAAKLSYEEFFFLIDLDETKGRILLGRGQSLPLSACLKLEKLFNASTSLVF